MDFSDSHKKIERSYQHIRNLDLLVNRFSESDFYTLAVEYNERQRISHLRFAINSGSFRQDAAVIVGDALHNLRSALDVLYYKIVPAGLRTKWTRFPLRETREELVARLKNALKEKQITSTIHDLILDRVKPYKAGNPLLWTLDDLNIIDKHQLLIPALQFMAFDGIRLEDEDDHSIITVNPIFMDESGIFRLWHADGRKVILKDKGHSAATIIFDQTGGIFAAQAIIPTLTRIAEEVTRTIETFEIILE